MENVLKGIPKVIVYLDDILISGADEPEHLQILEQVLIRLDNAGLRVKKEKCEFLVPSITYLGHKIDANGLHPLLEKVKAVEDVPSPQNIHELRAYLGLISHYSKFLPNMPTVLSPLYKLLLKSTKWCWSDKANKAFQDSKKLLTSSSLLVHFDPKLKLTLACDASAYGIGVVLAHKYPNGSEKPIAYASRTLTKAEQNYSQIEKEGLTCIYGVKHFHSYLFGHSFDLITDHKPLLTLFHEHKPTSPQASARIHRWSLLLAAYEYKIVSRGTQLHGNADGLSRLPLPSTTSDLPMAPELVLLLEHLAESPVTASDNKKFTRCDPVLSQVLLFVMQGWLNKCDTTLSAYQN